MIVADSFFIAVMAIGWNMVLGHPDDNVPMRATAMISVIIGTLAFFPFFMSMVYIANEERYLNGFDERWGK